MLVITSATSRLGRRGHILLIATTIFSASDLYYLYLDTRHQYLFSQVIDDGWLLAVILLVYALYLPAPDVATERSIHPALIAVAIFLSPALLAISALNPGLVPIYVVIISIANLILAFLRMSGAIHEARAIHNERELARTDELTGLPNRRRMMSDIENFARVEGALLLMDLDQFKPVNDLYGHDIGDNLLREVAKRLTKTLPEGDLLARLGGDEFGALIHGDRESTLEVAHALAATLSYPFRIKGHVITVGVSIGHCFNDGEGRLLERADLAMYQAKRNKAVVISQP
jgi:diguanylate cyclase (GGDEF)-like protein